MHAWMHEWKKRYMDGKMHEWKEGQMDGWKDGWINGWMDRGVVGQNYT